jgi:hypothetical protein
MRDSGFDLPTAVGEVVDNSIEAGALNIKIATGFEKAITEEINEIAFSDDGTGIDPEILENVLTLGYSTRYNSREGMGRFGVGMKLAGISHGKRIDVYTCHKDSNDVYHVYIDLDEIMSTEQEYITKEVVSDFPARYKKLMCDKAGNLYKTGTLVIWSKIDRLSNGGKYSSSLENKIEELTKFLARAYRYFIDKGIKIRLDQKDIFAHDPLFLLENPRAIKIIKEDIRSKIIQTEEFEIDGYIVEFTVTLLPEIYRMYEGEGGIKGSAKKFEPLYINDNVSKISIVRNNREIYYDVIPYILPGGKDQVDRYIGIELKFPAQLDEYFRVRHVKRGAEPVDLLRETFKKFLERPVKIARDEVRKLWKTTSREQEKGKKNHQDATDAVKEADKTAPKGRAGMGISQEEAEDIIHDTIKDMGVDPEKEPELAREKEKEIREQPITIVNADWPGKELMEIRHLNGKAIVKINERHPFFKEIYSLVKRLANSDPSGISSEEVVSSAKIIEAALDILLMAYAKAENLFPDPEEQFAELRNYWGVFAAAYVQELMKIKKG